MAQDYKKYMKVYNKKYKEGVRKISTLEDKYLLTSKHIDSPLLIEPTENNFIGTDRDEPRCCLQFGCGRKLSMEEQRFGNYCVHHQNKSKLDIAKHISFPIKKTA